MQTNTIVASILIMMLLGSMYMVTDTLTSKASQLFPSSVPRLEAFIFCHIVAICFMVRFMMLKDGKDHTLWAFQLTTSLCCIMSATEIHNVIQQHGMVDIVVESMEANESLCLSFYWISFIYSLITLFITALLLCLTFICEKIQAKRLQDFMNQYIRAVQYEETMEGFDCVICLQSFKQEEEEDKRIVQLSCKHIFHRKCLIQWIQQHQSCPNCRQNVFEQLSVDS